jgi:hypothetical protein
MHSTHSRFNRTPKTTAKRNASDAYEFKVEPTQPHWVETESHNNFDRSSLPTAFISSPELQTLPPPDNPSPGAWPTDGQWGCKQGQHCMPSMPCCWTDWAGFPGTTCMRPSRSHPHATSIRSIEILRHCAVQKKKRTTPSVQQAQGAACAMPCCAMLRYAVPCSVCSASRAIG